MKKLLIFLFLLPLFSKAQIGGQVDYGWFNHQIKILYDSTGNATTDSLCVWDPATKTIKQISPSRLSTSSTWQQTLITGSSLTQNNTIAGGNHSLIFNNLFNLDFNCSDSFNVNTLFAPIYLNSSHELSLTSGLSSDMLLNSSNRIALNLNKELLINGDGGAAGQVPISQGSGFAPVWGGIPLQDVTDFGNSTTDSINQVYSDGTRLVSIYNEFEGVGYGGTLTLRNTYDPNRYSVGNSLSLNYYQYGDGTRYALTPNSLDNGAINGSVLPASPTGSGLYLATSVDGHYADDSGRVTTGGGGANFANTDLVQTDNRYYDAARHDLILDSIENWQLTADSSFGENSNGDIDIAAATTDIGHGDATLEDGHGNNSIQVLYNGAISITSGHHNQLSMYGDSNIVLDPNLGNILANNIDSLTDSINYKPLMYNVSNHKIIRSNYWYGGSGSGGSGTVTSVATGFGLLGGTITTSGTLKADTAGVASLFALKDSSNILRTLINTKGSGTVTSVAGHSPSAGAVTLSTLTNGFGISGSPFNSSANQTWIIDTSSSGLVTNFALKDTALSLRSSPIGGDMAAQYDSLGHFSGNNTLYKYNYNTHALYVRDSVKTKNSRVYQEVLVGQDTVANGKYIIFYGDSHLTYPNPYLNTATMFCYNLNASIINLGIGGTRLYGSGGDSSMLSRINDIQHYNASLYSYIVFWYGTNDAGNSVTLSNFSSAEQAVIDTCLARGWPASKILWWGIPYLSSVYNALTPPYDSTLKAVAAANNVIYAGMFNYMQQNGGYNNALTGDSAHLSYQGNVNALGGIFNGIDSFPRIGVVQSDVVNSNLPSTFNGIQITALAPTSDTSEVSDVGVGRYLPQPTIFTGINDVMVGTNIMSNATTASNDNAFGVGALNFATTASNDNAFGYQSLLQNTTGSNNGAFGYQALYSNTNGGFNNAFGELALNDNTIGNFNQAFGRQALAANISGSGNTIGGDQASLRITGGQENTGWGDDVFYFQTSGNNNVAIGSGAAENRAAYSNCTFLGTNADATTSGLTNATAIGYNSQVAQSNSLILGSSVSVGIGTTAPNASALLDLTSTTQGLLIPRMTTAQATSISSPATGLQLFNTSINKNEFYNGSVYSPILDSGSVSAGSGITITPSVGGLLTISTNSTTEYVAKTSTYTIGVNDATIECTSGTFTLTLPTAVGVTGKKYVVKNSGAGTITLATTSSQNIDGTTTKILNTQYAGYTLQSNGANWIIIGTF